MQQFHLNDTFNVYEVESLGSRPWDWRSFDESYGGSTSYYDMGTNLKKRQQ